jgi:hypothetical protein
LRGVLFSAQFDTESTYFVAVNSIFPIDKLHVFSHLVSIVMHCETMEFLLLIFFGRSCVIIKMSGGCVRKSSG